VAKIALALGRTPDALAFLATAASASAALGTAYFNASSAFWDTGSQSAQALALSFDLGKGDLANFTGAVAAHLAADVLAHGTHLTTGTLGARWLLQALSTSGSGDVALALAAQTSAPSWGYMVRLSTVLRSSIDVMRYHATHLGRLHQSTRSGHYGRAGKTRRGKAVAR
jgi:alpha-L-rhamnosidase